MKIYRVIVMKSCDGRFDVFQYLQGISTANYYVNKEDAEKAVEKFQGKPWYRVEIAEIDVI